MVNTYTQIYIHIRIIFISSPKIHFPTRGSRLDAAPTELIACFSPVTIKILLLRSMPGPTNFQTPGPRISEPAVTRRQAPKARELFSGAR